MRFGSRILLFGYTVKPKVDKRIRISHINSLIKACSHKIRHTSFRQISPYVSLNFLKYISAYLKIRQICTITLKARRFQKKLGDSELSHWNNCRHSLMWKASTVSRNRAICGFQIAFGIPEKICLIYGEIMLEYPYIGFM